MSSERTRRAYAVDWHDFSGWCGRRGFVALPSTPATVALYVAALDESGSKVSTIRRRLAAIAARHRSSGYRSPTTESVVRSAMARLEQLRALEREVKAPLFPRDLRRMLRRLPDTVLGLRDRSLLLLGHATGLSRSELVALDLQDIDFQSRGLRLAVPRDNRARPTPRREIALASAIDADLCPVRATRVWSDCLIAEGLADGPLFRPINRHGHIGPRRLSDRAVSLIVKRAAAAAGLDPARYASHSLRRGAQLVDLLEHADAVAG